MRNMTVSRGLTWSCFVVLAVLLGSAHLLQADGILTNDFFAGTQAAGCKDVCPANTLVGFGDVSYGAPDAAVGFDSAESINAQDHFGLFARGSINSTTETGQGRGAATGGFLISLLIPPQNGQAQDDPGTLVLPYHLEGTTTIDWGEVFVDGFLVSFAEAHLAWDISSFEPNTPAHIQHMIRDDWSGNHVSDTINTNLNAEIPFRFGEVFYIDEVYLAYVAGTCEAPPCVGSVEVDFLHTGILGPAIVEDGTGDPLANPLIISDTGFDFTNPQGGSTSEVPEPRETGMLVSLLALGAFAWRKKARALPSRIAQK